MKPCAIRSPQAMVLNQESTELNVMLGLCVGHDSLFLKYAKALCTVLVVKDRVLGQLSGRHLSGGKLLPQSAAPCLKGDFL
ncbi:MAG: DUF1847 domain-containing protein [Desulfobacterales bacterium]